MSLERPRDIPPQWCSVCGDELLFSGTQSAGYAQFFCHNCRYRQDVYVGDAANDRSPETAGPDDPATAADD
ncbi:hypothetical protein NDI76_18880 [Halogeometricum sp. S1BR25-6]|uniref:Small CPxCG-related zinc finger protein n=1 Tax=Halogeometricum salsisoli TaxID=2950536 RepID=A0ABU2GJ17_9EURY|nr:HVO_2142 family zinc finger protein [Halogeometricum sp. S1BR25-6]MDS0300817.1 hypothetical protein [Halogeometricum sp. S1BR25-6]